EMIDLTGWTITGAGSNEKTLTLPEGSSIAPNSTYLITNYENGNKNTALVVLPNYTTATLSLPNDGFSLALNDALGSQVDVAGGSGSPFAGGSGGTADAADGRYRSMVRADGLVAGSDKTAWVDATTTSGFLGGVQDLGTPGMVEPVVEAHENSPVVIQSPDASVGVEGSQAEEVTAEAVVVTEETEIIVEQDPSNVSVPSDPVVAEDVIEEIPVVTVEDTAVEETTIDDTAESTVETVVKTVEVVIEPTVTKEPKPETVVVTQTVTHYTPHVILINEFVVDPIDGENEWIELVNRSLMTIALTGWTVEDASGKTTDLSSLTMTTGSYVVVDSPKGRLNNDTDTIILRDPTGQVIDSVAYGGDALPSPKDGEALARTGNVFVITQTPSPAQANQIETQEAVMVEQVAIVTANPVSDESPTVESVALSPEQQEKTVSPSPKKTSTAKLTSSTPKKTGSKAVLSSTIFESKGLPDDARVRLEGIVTALPGSFARQIFYLMDETGGIQVYFYDADFPQMSLGDAVSVTGVLSTSHGERRIKMSAQTNLAQIDRDLSVTPTVLKVAELVGQQVGSLVSVKGLVQTRENEKLVIEENGSTLIVSLKSEPSIDSAPFERGDHVTVTGILTSYDGELRLRPRSQDDIVVDEPAAALTLSTQDTGKGLFESTQAQTGIVLLVLTAAGLGLLAIRRNQNRQLTLGTP
ncbi:lamin tail domain-containing protein, partial [Candidatus Uhrbacteria bacterium]|nr:lamin tail domain-containing protein [Candidatus Uhrbacteria bacterium]